MTHTFPKCKMLEFQSQIHFKKIQSWLEERFDLDIEEKLYI